MRDPSQVSVSWDRHRTRVPKSLCRAGFAGARLDAFGCVSLWIMSRRYGSATGAAEMDRNPSRIRRHLCSWVLLTLAVAPARAAEAGPASCPLSLDYYGKSIEVFGLFGQNRITETARNLVTANGVYHAAGVVVDRSAPTDRLRIYVVDTGNSRVLGFDVPCPGGTPCSLDGSRPADVVFGQPDLTSASCNGDNNLGFTRAPSESCLCLLGHPYAQNNAEAFMRVNIDVDGQGNLYVPDVHNNRVLKYNAPFSTDPTGGKGDAVADRVWGQDDMTSNGRNRGSHYGPAASPDDSSLWISYREEAGFDYAASRGVSVDAAGNVWIADTYNSRVLRFPPESSQADLVLGQADFNASGCVANGPLNRMCMPTLARVHPETGDLYVLDESPGFQARILVFRPQFMSGMVADRVIVPVQGPVTNWPEYTFQCTGFVFNPFREGAYAAGEIWLNELDGWRTLLIAGDGTIVAVIGAQNSSLRGGDNTAVYPGGCPSIYEWNHLWAPGGSIGFDGSNNIYLADDKFHTVHRHALPYVLEPRDSVVCLPEPNGVLFPEGGPNRRSDARLGEAVGVAVHGNQLLVLDEFRRLKVYDDYEGKPFGVDPNHVLTGEFQPGNWLSAAIDDRNRLWLSGVHGRIMIYQLPLTSGAVPNSPVTSRPSMLSALAVLDVIDDDFRRSVRDGGLSAGKPALVFEGAGVRRPAPGKSLRMDGAHGHRGRHRPHGEHGCACPLLCGEVWSNLCMRGKEQTALRLGRSQSDDGFQ